MLASNKTVFLARSRDSLKFNILPRHCINACQVDRLKSFAFNVLSFDAPHSFGKKSGKIIDLKAKASFFFSVGTITVCITPCFFLSRLAFSFLY